MIAAEHATETTETLAARWGLLPRKTRADIKRRIEAVYPDLASLPRVIHALCLEEMEVRFPVTSTTRERHR